MLLSRISWCELTDNIFNCIWGFRVKHPPPYASLPFAKQGLAGLVAPLTLAAAQLASEGEQGDQWETVTYQSTLRNR